LSTGYPPESPPLEKVPYTVPVTGQNMNGVKNFLNYVHRSKLVRLATKDDDPFGAAR